MIKIVCFWATSKTVFFFLGGGVMSQLLLMCLTPSKTQTVSLTNFGSNKLSNITNYSKHRYFPANPTVNKLKTSTFFFTNNDRSFYCIRPSGWFCIVDEQVMHFGIIGHELTNFFFIKSSDQNDVPECR